MTVSSSRGLSGAGLFVSGRGRKRERSLVEMLAIETGTV